MKVQNKVSIIRIFTYIAIVSSVFLGILASSGAAFAQSNNPQGSSSSWGQGMLKVSELDLTAISIILSTSGGVFVYWAGESWKRRQYIEGKIKDFEVSLETINVRKMISAELQCIELFPFVDSAKERFVIVEDYLWTEALLECKCNHTLKEQYHRIDRNRPLYEQDPAVKSCIRDNFNRFLFHLQHFEKMIEAKALDQKKLRSYLYPWFESIREVGNEIYAKCPSTKEKYTPQEALLEYMGLLERTPEESLSIVQKDVRALVTRYRSLNSFLETKSNQHQLQNVAGQCSNPEAA